MQKKKKIRETEIWANAATKRKIRSRTIVVVRVSLMTRISEIADCCVFLVPEPAWWDGVGEWIVLSVHCSLFYRVSRRFSLNYCWRRTLVSMNSVKRLVQSFLAWFWRARRHCPRLYTATVSHNEFRSSSNTIKRKVRIAFFSRVF